MRSLVFAMLVVAVVVCLGGTAFATDYFVATWGNDGWPGTIDQPFLTITQGTLTAQPGDTVNVRAGSYAEGRLDFYRDGAPGAPITVLSYDGDHAAHVTDGVYIHGRSYIDLVGMQVSGSTNALHIDPGDSKTLVPRSTYISITRCYVHDPGGGDVVKANQSDYVEIQDSVIAGASGDEQCDWVWVNYSAARRCFFYDFNAYAFTQKGGSRYNVLEDSVISNGIGSFARATRFGGGTDRKYRDPTTTYATEYGVYRNNIMREAPDGATGTYECWYAYFYNNTVHNCGESGIVVHHMDPGGAGDGGSRHLFFFNNVFMDTDGDMATVYYDQSGKPYEDWQHDHNNYWNAGNPIPSDGLFDPNLEPNSTFGDPNLANPTGTATTYAGWLDCYRITSSSALLIDQGSSTAGNDPRPAVHTDIEGTARPQGAAWDIGAFEYVGGPVPPVANFSGNPTAGPPPLTVYFTDLSSGNPTSWDWTFGDGGSSPAQHPSHQYTVADLYTVSLTAYNAQGQDTETKVDYINVSIGPTQSCHVGDIAMANGGTPGYKAAATITVHDQACAPLAGVTVDATWSGAAPGSASGVTNGQGQVTFTSGRNKSGGTFTICVDSLTLSGYPYESGDNHETWDSITLP